MVPNYGWAIVLMTILIKVVLLPLTHKSYVSMQKMQELAPRIKAIRAKYKGKLRDKKGRPDIEQQRKMNEEIQALYRTEGVNPAGGCLPMLHPVPGPDRVLPSAVARHRAAGRALDRCGSTTCRCTIRSTCCRSSWARSSSCSRRLAPSSAEPMQRRMMMAMPVVFTFLFLGFPSGLVLYWLTNNVLTLIQQWVYHQRGRKRRGSLSERECRRGRGANMSDKKRKFFSGRSIEQAVMAAASYYGLVPEELAYREIEKKHGFVRVRRNAVIAVDPENPRKRRRRAEAGRRQRSVARGRRRFPRTEAPRAALTRAGRERGGGAEERTGRAEAAEPGERAGRAGAGNRSRNRDGGGGGGAEAAAGDPWLVARAEGRPSGPREDEEAEDAEDEVRGRESGRRKAEAGAAPGGSTRRAG